MWYLVIALGGLEAQAGGQLQVGDRLGPPIGHEAIVFDFSFYDILKQTYCGCFYKQNDNLRPNLRSRLDSINYPAPRTSRSWSDVTGMTAVLSRVHAYRKDTPPPPYEAPPSYQVAIRMEMEEEDPPGYEESGTFIV